MKSKQEGSSAEPVAWLKRLLGGPKEQDEGKQEETNKPDKVYLVKGLPQLPRKMVDKIQRGEFVEFADFTVFDGGHREGEWSAERSEKDELSPARQVGEPKRKGPREVPDVSWWGTCFTLYERA